MGELGANALSPFQRLGEDLSSSLTGGLDSLKTGAQGAVTKNIGSPLEASKLVEAILGCMPNVVRRAQPYIEYPEWVR